MSGSVNKAPFPYDAFVIVVLLAVSCGCLMIALSQVEAILYFSDQMAFLVLVSTAVLTVLISIFAAFLRYQSMETENKAVEFTDKIKQLQEKDDGDERVQKAILIYKKKAQKKKQTAGKFTKFSGIAITGAIVIIMAGFLYAVGSIWVVPITEMMAEQTMEGEEGEEEGEEEEEE